MTETKWTKGPWGTENKQGHGTGVAAIAPVAWCGISTLVGANKHQSISSEQAYANAQLIAAAPDLYEALEAIFQAGQWYESALEIDAHREGDAPDGCQLEAMAMAALAKARGES